MLHLWIKEEKIELGWKSTIVGKTCGNGTKYFSYVENTFPNTSGQIK